MGSFDAVASGKEPGINCLDAASEHVEVTGLKVEKQKLCLFVRSLVYPRSLFDLVIAVDLVLSSVLLLGSSLNRVGRKTLISY